MPSSRDAARNADPGVFIATGASVFHSAHICSNSEVRINGVVHLKTRLEEGSVVPIGWVAVGNPAAILPPDKHDEIWEKQAPLDFPLSVYGLQRADANVANITRAFRASLALDDER
jgi:carbonic anhydrase/acetyltransferase-like protein (isoleucine patch superfamily)